MNVEIAERLAARRKEAGLSQEALAEQLGVSRQAVSKWERSESSPDTDNLIALAKLYGVSLDDLLYVDHSIEADVEFEAADRAAERKAAETASVGTPGVGTTGTGTTNVGETASLEGTGKAASDHAVPDGSATSADNAASTDNADPATGTTGGTVPPTEGTVPPTDPDWSFGHTHYGTPHDRTEYAHIGSDGIHFADGGDTVHISWRDGIHVKESKKGDEVHVGWDGIHVNEGARDDTEEGRAHQVSIDRDGIFINGRHFDTWQEAQEYYHHKHWGPTGYTVNGEYFSTLGEARDRFGDEVGRSIPIHKHYVNKTWLKFPFPLVAIIAYLLAGFMANAWGVGLFIFFTIPLYYMLARAVSSKKVAPFIAGAYPLCTSAWFLYMAFVVGAWHPAWVIFLTIPVVEWVVHAISRWWRRRRKDDDAINVEVQGE